MVELTLPLPCDYRVADVLAFHARDTAGTAEQVQADGLRKGVVLAGQAVLLEVRFGPGAAHCRIEADGRLTRAARTLADEALQSILGLRIDPAPFLAYARAMPELAPLVARTPGLRIVQSATIFEALTWAIIGQQINLPFAIALRRSFILLAGRRHRCGLWCYPEAADVARLEADQLAAHKFSRAKAQTLLRVAQLVADGALSLARDLDVQTIATQLLAVKGIGPWTVNYALLRGYGYPDCSLHGDVAIRTALQRIVGGATRPDMAQAEAWLARFRPHRTMTAAHLWASLAASPPASTDQ